MDIQQLPNFTNLPPLSNRHYQVTYLAFEEASRLCRLSWFYVIVVAIPLFILGTYSSEGSLDYSNEFLKWSMIVAMSIGFISVAFSLFSVGSTHLTVARSRADLRLIDRAGPAVSDETPSVYTALAVKLVKRLGQVAMALRSALAVYAVAIVVLIVAQLFPSY